MIRTNTHASKPLRKRVSYTYMSPNRPSRLATTWMELDNVLSSLVVFVGSKSRIKITCLWGFFQWLVRGTWSAHGSEMSINERSGWLYALARWEEDSKGWIDENKRIWWHWCIDLRWNGPDALKMQFNMHVLVLDGRTVQLMGPILVRGRRTKGQWLRNSTWR